MPLAADEVDEVRRVDLPGPEVRASDLLPQWSASTAVFAKSPLPGATRRVPRGELARWARAAGLEATSLPAALLLRRRTRTVGEDEAGDRIAQAVAAQASRPLEQITVEVLSLGRPVVPDGELSFKPGGPFRILNRAAHFSLRWSEAGGRSGVLTVEAVIRVQGRWLQARHDLRAGATLDAGAFELREGDLDDASRDYVESFDELVGRRLNRPVRAETALLRAALAVKPDIERGDIVDLRVRIGGVQLRTAARAESAGSRGDLIALRNLESGGRVLARIVDSRTAEVDRR